MDNLLTAPTSPTGWAIAVASGLALSFSYRYATASRPHFPPGPKPAPLIGNVLQIPADKAEEKFREWSNEYGDVFYMHILGQPMVVLGSSQAAHDLLDKRSAIYSDRPRFVLFSELMGWEEASTHVRYGPKFRKHRRFIHQTFNEHAVLAFRPLQDQERYILLDNFLRSPDSYIKHFRRYAAATILKVTYGHDVTTDDDEFVRLAERAGTLTVESGTPAATLVDYIPAMMYIPAWAPLGGFKRTAHEVKKAVDLMMNVPFNKVKQEMKSGAAIPSFTSILLESQCQTPDAEENAQDEQIIKGIAGTLFAAAEDTSLSALETFMLAMVLHPEIFEKAQDEIDRVIGNERLPTLEDRPSLPYLECIVKEVYRWNPPVPLGFPHRLIEDDVYRGYHIPAGTTVVANIFGIARDCAEPDSFMPERYLNNDDLIDPRDLAFGFGRRVCPGRYFVEPGVWSIISNIVAAFHIKKAVGADGKEITPPIAFNSGFVRHPKPFQCNIHPRSEKISNIIRQNSAAARS